MVSIELVKIYFDQSKNAQTKQLAEKALLINKEIGDRVGESTCYVILGVVHCSVGEYKKAKEHLDPLVKLPDQLQES